MEKTHATLLRSHACYCGHVKGSWNSWVLWNCGECSAVVTAAYSLAYMSSKSPLVKLCAFWVPSEAFMSGVPAFILGCRRTLHFYKECLRVGLPWCALGCRTGFLSQRTTRSPKSLPALAFEETQEILCIWECWDLLKCADAKTERSVWSVGN